MRSTPEALCGRIGIVPRSQRPLFTRSLRIEKTAAHLHEPVRRSHTQRTRRCRADSVETRFSKYRTGE